MKQPLNGVRGATGEHSLCDEWRPLGEPSGPNQNYHDALKHKANTPGGAKKGTSPHEGGSAKGPAAVWVHQKAPGSPSSSPSPTN